MIDVVSIHVYVYTDNIPIFLWNPLQKKLFDSAHFLTPTSLSTLSDAFRNFWHKDLNQFFNRDKYIYS